MQKERDVATSGTELMASVQCVTQLHLRLPASRIRANKYKKISFIPSLLLFQVQKDREIMTMLTTRKIEITEYLLFL